ncbi:facilitated trehalose transporter Tret1-like [Prorops nasuta]|uniref:facilitated trehalose transporter Tret1-like n=1 Tax=Prorops nasuta TaxID=863751 RepID=UPI0034CEB718
MADSYSELVKRRLPQYVAATAACMSGFTLGCGIGWSAVTVEILKDEYQIDSFLVSVIASIFSVGAAVGITIVPFLIDFIGRKWTMMALMPPMVLGWVFLMFANDVVALYILGRIITGGCGGMLCVAAPLFVAEISEKEIRGTLGVFFQLLLVIGILYTYCTGFAQSILWISLLCCLSSVLLVIIMLFIPESPLFFMIKGREDNARKAMRFFRGPNFDIEPEMSGFKEQAEQLKTAKPRFKSFLQKPILKSLGIAYGLMVIQQFSGINVMIFYGQTVFKSTGVDMDPLLQLLAFAVVQVISCVISASLIDKLGRKTLMIISQAIMGICLVAVGIFYIFRNSNPDVAATIQWLPLTSICCYIAAYCLGVGPIPWAYMAEIFPTRYKGVATSSVAFLNWILAFLVTVTYQSAAEAFGEAAVMFCYAIVCGIGIAFVILCMYETKGKTLIQIQKDLGTFDLENVD